MNSTIFQALKTFLIHRAYRLYDTFYNAQYTNKWTLLIVFPGIFSYIRYRAETKIGYYIYIQDNQIIPSTRLINFNLIPYLNQYFPWKQGTKIYLHHNATVKQLKERLYKANDQIPNDILVGCQGKFFKDTDNLAIVNQLFCKFDNRLILWRDIYN